MDHNEVMSLMKIMKDIGTTDHRLVHIRNHAVKRLHEINDSLAPAPAPQERAPVEAEPESEPSEDVPEQTNQTGLRRV